MLSSVVHMRPSIYLAKRGLQINVLRARAVHPAITLPLNLHRSNSSVTKPSKEEAKEEKKPVSAVKPKPKEPLMQRIKHEIRHYVNGTKLASRLRDQGFD